MGDIYRVQGLRFPKNRGANKDFNILGGNYQIATVVPFLPVPR